MTEDVAAIVEAVVRERLAEAQVQRVTVQEDEDHEGDRILRVMVVFDDSKGKLDPQRTLSLARHVRSRLDVVNAFLPPVFRFVSAADAARIPPAAA